MYEILVVEDEYAERRELAGLMEALVPARHIRCAATCEAAIQMIDQLTPDLILLDIMLKGRSGFEVAQHVRSRGLDCRIMILTAYNEFDFASKAMSVGIQDYLLKPMRPDLLLQRIRGVLSRPAGGRAQPPQLWPSLACGMTFGLPQPLPRLPARVVMVLLSAPLSLEEGEALSAQAGPEELAESYRTARLAACSGPLFPQRLVCRYTPWTGEREPYPDQAEARLIRALRSGEDTIQPAGQLCARLLSGCRGDAAILEGWLELYCAGLRRACGQVGADWRPELDLEACFTPRELSCRMGELAARAAGLLAPDSRADHPLVARTIAIVESRYPEPLKLEGVAREQFVSPAYLGRIFHAHTGQTFRDYLTRVRLGHAARLLEEGASVSAAAAAVGYEDPNYFSRVYKKQFGYPPKEGRR